MERDLSLVINTYLVVIDRVLHGLTTYMKDYYEQY